LAVLDDVVVVVVEEDEEEVVDGEAVGSIAGGVAVGETTATSEVIVVESATSAALAVPS